jgi:DNA-binding SARP family transcriptional activator/predicted ATPase
MIRITLLGQFMVERDGKAVEVTSRPAQSLLSFLALSPGTRHLRAKLAGLFWPESTESNARSNLRQSLWRLRTAIGSEYILVDSRSIAFNQNADHWIDATILDRQLPGDAADDLMVSVSAYGGELLPGFYDNWVVLERERLQALFERHMRHLLDRLVEERRWDDVLRWAERWIGLGHVPEPAYRALMVAHSEQGDLSSVAAVYRRCAEALDEELAVEPSAETRGLYRRLTTAEEPETARNGDGVADQVGDLPAVQPALMQPESVTPHRRKELFVGHERELEFLSSHLTPAVKGHGRMAFVSGEAGSGKTTLLNEFARRVQQTYPELIVASGACSIYTGVGDPFLPFREILRMLTGDIEQQWAAGVISRDQSQRLRRLMPQAAQVLVRQGPHLIGTFLSGELLADRVAAATQDRPGWIDQLLDLVGRRPTTTGSQGPSQSHVFEQYADVLGTLAGHQPLVIFLDDLHWADLSSVSLLSHLGRRVVDSPILIVGTYRPEDVAQGRDGKRHPLEGVLSELKRQYGDISLPLDQADQAQGRAFIDALLDDEPNRLGESFRRELTQHTGGHPLFTVELIRDMKERGDLSQDEHGRWIQGPAVTWGMLPPRVEGVIKRRIGRLDVGLREWLNIASVEGESFTAEVIARVQSVNERELVLRLSGNLDKRHRLVDALGVQRLGSQRLSRYRFRHSLFHAYLYTGLDEIERSFLHEAVGNALEHLYGGRTDEIATQLAHHFLTAELTPKAIKYLQEAGDGAARVCANDEAIAFYSQALALAVQSKAASQDLAYLYTQLGRSLELKDRYDDALANYERMERDARDRDARTMLLTALVARFTLHAIISPVHDPVSAEELFEQTSGLARELGDQAAEATILWNTLNLYRHTNRIKQAVKYGERSLKLARELNLHQQTAFTLNDIAHCYHGIGHFNRAKDALREASAIWTKLGNRPMLADSLSSLVWSQLYTGEFDEALRASNEAYAICQSIGNVRGQAYSRLVIGFVNWDRGQPDRALDTMEECIRLADLADFPAPQLTTRTDLAKVYAGLGDPQRGLALAHLALVVAEEQFPVYRAYPLSILAEIHLMQDNLAEAAVALDEARREPISETYPIYEIHILQAESRFALSRGDDGKAVAVTETLLATLQQFGAKAFMPDALFLAGQAFAAQGQTEPARERLQGAHLAAQELGSRRMQWPILFSLSQLEADPAEALRLRQQAREIIRFISGNISTAEMRSAFLNQPQVRAVFESAE